jgi:uncharacterized membrane protein YccC
MAGITVVIVLMTGAETQDVLGFGLARVLEICIGILCAFAVSVLIFPKRKVDVLRQKLAEQADACGEKCHILVKAFISQQQQVSDALVEGLVKDVWNNHALLEQVRRNEALIYRKRFRENFSHKVSLLHRSAEHLRNMARALNGLDGKGHDIIMATELTALTDLSNRALGMFVSNSPVTVKNDLASMLTQLDARLLTLRKEGLTRRFETPKLIQVFSFYSSLLYYAEDILSVIEASSAEGPATPLPSNES